jgi:uncharacterized protein (TIGR02271 family)
MPDVQELTAWRGLDVVDRSGDKIGKVEEIYLDDATGQPEWLAIRTGMFGSKQSFVPIQGADSTGDQVRVQWEKAQVKDAPTVDPDGELSQDEEERLYQHYGMSYGESRSESGLPQGGMGTAGADADRDRDLDRDRDVETSATTGGGVVGRDVSGPETDEAMTRSEEEMRVGVARRETGRARLRKHIVSEPVQETVTTQREELRVEREPITDANAGAAMSGGDLTEEEHEVTLSAEEAVVEKRVVPKERVRLDKDVVQEQQTVTDEIRKEEIEVDDATTGTRGDVDIDRPGPGR